MSMQKQQEQEQMNSLSGNPNRRSSDGEEANRYLMNPNTRELVTQVIAPLNNLRTPDQARDILGAIALKCKNAGLVRTQAERVIYEAWGDHT